MYNPVAFDPKRPGVLPGRIWVRSQDGRARCNLCYRRCIVEPGSFGACGVRYNHNGDLYTLVYGILTAANADPIEKKPLMHFNPGASVFTISTSGCNFYCKFCDNWVLSQSRQNNVFGEPYEPEDVIDQAKHSGCQGISYSYNEPTIFFEFMYDVAALAKKNGLFNTMVTNGYITPEGIRELRGLVDAATVDFKGGGNKHFYAKYMGVPDPAPIFDSLIAMKREDWWIEITNLVVPEIGDRVEDVKNLARWMVENLGEETPLHLLRFHPDYMLQEIPATPIETLERLAKVAFEEGLKHVYIGNLWGHPLENTYCPKCGNLAVERRGFFIFKWNLKEDFTCISCGYRLNFRGSFQGRRYKSLFL
ncbi:MAG: AmmeMemoRadiSam system radical SAM enzyme [Desulfurococcaceae archaeon]